MAFNVRYETDADDPEIGWTSVGDIDFGTRQAHLRRTWPYDPDRVAEELRVDAGTLWMRRDDMPDRHWFTVVSNDAPIVALVPGLLPSSSSIASTDVSGVELPDGDVRFTLTLSRGELDRRDALWMLYAVKPSRTLRGRWTCSLRVHKGEIVRALLAPSHVARHRRLIVFETVLGAPTGDREPGMPHDADVHTGGFARQFIQYGGST